MTSTTTQPPGEVAQQTEPSPRRNRGLIVAVICFVFLVHLRSALVAILLLPLGILFSFIVMFHQAGWSRGEYREIAPKLVAKGYRVLAVDQRAGRGGMFHA